MYIFGCASSRNVVDYFVR